MESSGVETIKNAIEASPIAWNLAGIIFWSGVIFLSFYIKKVNNLTITETLLATIGLHKIKRNWKINLGHFLVLIIPMSLMLYVMASYKA